MRSTLLVFALIILTPLVSIGGYYFTDHKEIGALILLPIFYFGYKLYENSFNSKVDTGYLGNEEDFIDSILQLAAIVIKLDGQPEKRVLLWVEKALKEDFKSPHDEEYYLQFRKYLEGSAGLREIATKVNAEFDVSGKIQLLNFLVRICAIDKELSENEFDFLKRIVKLFHLNTRVLNSFLVMHGLRIKNSRKKTNSRKRSSSFKYSLQEAYQILSITESVSDRAVKKAYRKLAVIHHPDKVAHLGEAVQKNAESKFQKIAEAYDLIKKKRGFS